MPYTIGLPGAVPRVDSAARAPLVSIAGQPSLRNPGATTVDYPPDRLTRDGMSNAAATAATQPALRGRAVVLLDHDTCRGVRARKNLRLQ